MKVDICMLLNLPVDNHSRVLREAQALQEVGWSVLILHLSSYHNHQQYRQVNSINVLDVPLPNNFYHTTIDNIMKLLSYILVGVSYIFLGKPPNWFLWLFLRTTRLWMSKYQIAVKALKNIEATYIHAHDYLTLPIPFAAFESPNVIYDSHELFFEQYQPPMAKLKKMLTARKRKLEYHLEYQFVHRCVSVIAVSKKSAEYMEDYHNLTHVEVIRHLVDAPLTQPVIDYETGDKMTVVHVGNLNKGRQLDVLIKAFQYLPESFALVLMGKGELTEELKHLAKSLGLTDRVNFMPPVAPEHISATLAQANISAVLNPHGGLNRERTYPQKLFESIAAGLPMITTDTLSILDLIKEYDFGIIVDPTDARAVAQAIEKMAEPDTYTYYKEKVLLARETLNWQTEKQRLTQLYEDLRQNS